MLAGALVGAMHLHGTDDPLLLSSLRRDARCEDQHQQQQQ
jgi:hypothetical protein